MSPSYRLSLLVWTVSDSPYTFKYINCKGDHQADSNICPFWWHSKKYQELSWTTIHSIPSSKNKEGEDLVGVPNHPNWLTFTNNSSNTNDYLRVITYVNIRLSYFHFSLHKDIYNYRDISLVSFFNNNNVFFLINIYSDLLQSALKYFKNTEVDICNVLIMTDNFNIRDSL